MSSIRARKGLSQFNQEYQKEQQAAEEQRLAPIHRQAQRTSELQAQIEETERQIVRQSIFVKPSDYLTDRCTKYNGTLTAEEVEVEIGNAVNALKLHLDETRGIEITPSGIAKLAKVAAVNPALDLTNEYTIRAMWQHLDDNGCLSASDFKVVRQIQPTAEAEPTAKRTLEQVQSELEELRDIDTPVGRMKARQLKSELLSLEVINSGLWSQWCAFVRENYDPFERDEQERCTQWFGNNDLILNVANLNKYRIVRGWLTPDEKLAASVEEENTRLSDYQTRKAFIKAQRNLGEI